MGMNNFQLTLQKYWGYTRFRPLQEDIIRSVYEGNDTLGLLPTGGGKSLCFQVPAMMREGVCLVVTPLIALMKDQVENLQQRNIPAVMVSSGMEHREIEIVLTNCVNDPKIRFLYLSPERLGTENFRAMVTAMKVSFIVVDEAHCISQWGYDFRPSYLKIAEIREYLPGVPVLALTATATPDVVDDIQNQLKFANKNVFSKSFERKNLTYAVRRTDNKNDKLLQICKSIPGTGIVYVRNRRKTAEYAAFLRHHGLTADYYHAGLDHETRNRKQKDWKENRTRIIVSTNAFGMGIDKPDVRFVVHIEPPDSLEAYYQEAGRGGRDELQAWAVLLADEADRDQMLKQIEISFPPPDEIRRVYHALGNYLQIPVGSGKDSQHPFSITAFAQHYKFEILTTFNALKLLEKEGLIALTDEISNPSRLLFTASKRDLYNFQVKYTEYDTFIKFLARSYSGIFSSYARIDESVISKKMKVTEDQIIRWLQELKKYDILDYLPRNKSPYIIYTEQRIEEKSVYFSHENYRLRKEKYIEKIQAVLKYTYTDTRCRSVVLREYFGEKDPRRCGTCDVCMERNELGLSRYEFDLINEKLKTLLTSGAMPLNQVLVNVPEPQEKVTKVIRWLLDHEKLIYDNENCLLWNQKTKK